MKNLEENTVTTENAESLVTSAFTVFHDLKFHTQTSGFDAIKNSGYLSKIQGTEIESKLYDYYHLVDKIVEQERSLHETTESLEVLVFADNIPGALSSMVNSMKYLTNTDNNRNEVLEWLHHPSLKGANIRNSVVSTLPIYYAELIEIGQRLLILIDGFIKS